MTKCDLYFPNTHAQKTWVLGFYHLTYQQRYDTIQLSANRLLTIDWVLKLY